MKSWCSPVDIKINPDPKVLGTNIGKAFGDKVDIKNQKLPGQPGFMKNDAKAQKPKREWHFKAPAPYNRHLCRSCAAFTIFAYLAVAAAFCAISATSSGETLQTNWVAQGIILFAVAMFSLISLALFIPQVVREFKLMLHRQDIKGSLLLNIFNIFAAILGFAFIIVLAVKGATLLKPVEDGKVLAKICIDIGIMALVIFYMNQYSFMAKNKRYLDASGAIRFKRTLLFTIGIASLFTFAALIWWSFMSLNAPKFPWKEISSLFALETLSVLGGGITLLLLVVLFFGIFAHKAIEKDPKFVKHTVVNSIFEVILFVLMIVVACRLNVNKIQVIGEGAAYGETVYVVFTEFYGILCFVVGIMSFASSKLIARKPKVATAK